MPKSLSSSEYNEDARLMSLAGCNLDFNEVDVDLFDFLHPSCENKAFRLIEEYDWACAFLLCAKRCECSQEIFKKIVKKNSMLFLLSQVKCFL